MPELGSSPGSPGSAPCRRLGQHHPHSDISCPQQTLLKKNPPEIHNVPWGVQGGPCVPPHIFVQVTGEKPGSVAVGGFPSLSGKRLRQSACCRRRGAGFQGWGDGCAVAPPGFRAALCEREGHAPLTTHARPGTQPSP